MNSAHQTFKIKKWTCSGKGWWTSEITFSNGKMFFIGVIKELGDRWYPYYVGEKAESLDRAYGFNTRREAMRNAEWRVTPSDLFKY